MKIISVFIIFILIGCATVSSLKPDERELSTMRQKVPGVTFEDVKQGFKLYKYNCSGCHYLHKPSDYTSSEWEKVLPEMLERAKITSEKDKRLIQDYLLIKSK